MLTSEDFYDILAANERLLEQSRLAQRLATETPRNAQLQERYLQQAAKLGLIPARFSSPARLTPAVATSITLHAGPTPTSPTSAKRPVPPHGYGGGRPSRDRVARELARADSALCNSAAASLAATQALYRGQQQQQHRFQSGSRATTSASASSDSETSVDSHSTTSTTATTATTATTTSTVCSLRGLIGADRSRGSRHSSGSGGAGVTDAAVSAGGSDGGRSSPRSARRDRGSGLLTQQLARGGGTVQGGGRVGRQSAVSRADGGGSGGGSSSGSRRVGQVLREPTPAFLRRWRAARKRKAAKKQVVRFLLRTPDERGELADGESCSGAAGSGARASARGRRQGSEGGSFGAGGVVIAYPGSSVLFPPASLPYSLSEALEAVRQQAAQLQLGRDYEWDRTPERRVGAAAPSQPLTPPHHPPSRVFEAHSPRRDAAVLPAPPLLHHQHQQQHHYQQHQQHQQQHQHQQQNPLEQHHYHHRPAFAGLELAASPAGQYPHAPPSPQHLHSSVGSPSLKWVSPHTVREVGGEEALMAAAATPWGALIPMGGLPAAARAQLPGGQHPTQQPQRAPWHPPDPHQRPPWEDDDDYESHPYDVYDTHVPYGGVASPGTPRGFANTVSWLATQQQQQQHPGAGSRWGSGSGGGAVHSAGMGGAGGGSSGGIAAGGARAGGGNPPGFPAGMTSLPGRQAARHSPPLPLEDELSGTGGYDGLSSEAVGRLPPPRGTRSVDLPPGSAGRSGSEASFSPGGSGATASHRHRGGAAAAAAGGAGGSGAGGGSAAGAAAFGGYELGGGPAPSGAISGSVGEMERSGEPGPGVWAGEEEERDGDVEAEAEEAEEADGQGAPPSGVTSYRSLRSQQSAIFRDMHMLMQRLADMRGRLGT